MTKLRVGTRGSDLALRQTRWVVERLRKTDSALQVEEVIIRTHGDLAAEQRIEADWPVGGFVSAIEQALLDGRVDFAVHSYKDLPTRATAGLVVAAVPEREVVHDVLVSSRPVLLEAIPAAFRVGTGSPRRGAQLRRIAPGVEIVPIRGNVPTRLAMVDGKQLDAVVLAAAGLARLEVQPPHRLDLPIDQFLPAPAQGALAVQTLEEAGHIDVFTAINMPNVRREVDAERSLLRAVGAGCHAAVGAHATARESTIRLCAELFADDGRQFVRGDDEDEDPVVLGERLAARLLRELRKES